jgi:hypothetical protein
MYDILLASWLPSRNFNHLDNLKAKITTIHVAPPWYVYGCCGVRSGRTDIDISPAHGTEPTANSGYNGYYRHYRFVTHDAQRHFLRSVQFFSEKLDMAIVEDFESINLGTRCIDWWCQRWVIVLFSHLRQKYYINTCTLSKMKIPEDEWFEFEILSYDVGISSKKMRFVFVRWCSCRSVSKMNRKLGY